MLKLYNRLGTKKLRKKANQEVKKVARDANLQSSNHMKTYIGEIFSNLKKMRERKSRNLNHVRCIRSEDQKILLKDNDIIERWRGYFNKLLNEESFGGLR